MRTLSTSCVLGILAALLVGGTALAQQSIPLLNSDFESPTWVWNGSGYALTPVASGTQAPNYNELDPRFGVPGWAKTAVSGNYSSGNIGPNGEGIYSERNDCGVGQFFNYVNGNLPAPANGKNFFCIQPSSPSFTPGDNSSWSAVWSNSWPGDGQASDVNSYRYNYAPGTCVLSNMYNFWVDQQPDQTTLAGDHGNINYPPMIPATTAHAGHTYQATVALGNPLWNATNGNSNFPVVELEFTIGAGTYPMDNNSWLWYNGYGATAAQSWANGSSDANWQIAPGTFKDLTLTWTCPPADDGKPLNIQLNFTGFTQTPGTSLPNMVAMDNVRLVDESAPPPDPLAWTGASDTNWSNAANWGGTVPGGGDVAPFNLNGAYPNQPNLTAASSVAALWVTGSGAVAISGSPLTINSGTINSAANVGIEMDAGAGSLAISAPLVLGGAQSWLNNSSNPLSVSGNVDNGGNLLTVAGSGSTTISGSLRGLGGFTVSGPGACVLTGANSYAGATTLNGGTLRIVSGGQIYSTFSGFMAGAITVNSGAALEFDNYAYGACFGQLWDSSGNIVVNGGTLRYIGSGNNSGGHSFTIGPNGATLDAASSGQLWTITNDDVHSLASNGGMLTLTGVGNGQIDQIIPGSGGLTMNGPGMWTLTNANTYTGPTTVSGGTLAVTGAGQIYSNLNWASATVTVTGGGVLLVDRWGGNGSLGQLSYSQNNLVIDGGTVQYTGASNNQSYNDGPGFTIGAAGATLVSAQPNQSWYINLDDRAGCQIASNGGTLTLAGAGNGEIDKVIPGGGGLTMNGPGTWTLANNNTYTGDTNVNGGTLNLAAHWGTLAGNLTVNNGGTVYVSNQDGIWPGAANAKTLTINAGGLVTLDSQPCDLGSVVLSGGTLTGSGEPSWGSWWLNGGVTATGSAVSTMSATGMTLPQTQTFFVDSSSTLNVIGSFIPTAGSNAGGIIKTGPGMMVLANTNSYTGDTTVNGGTLNLADNIWGAGAMAGNLMINDSGTVYVSYHDALFGPSNLKNVTINSGGLLTLASAVCDLGPVTLSGGTLDGAGDPHWGSWWLNNTITATGGTVSTISAMGVTLPHTQTFFVDSSSTLNVTGNIIPTDAANAGGIIKTGAGTMILSGSNTYTGSTTVEDGTLIVANPYSLPDSTELTVGDPTLFAHAPVVTVQSTAPVPVPEPATSGLLAAGVVATLVAVVRRKRKGRCAKTAEV